MVIERAFVRAHLMRNPFGEPTPAERAALAILRVPVPARGAKVQLLGEKGAGKSSALRALARAMPGAQYAWVDEHGRVDAPIDPSVGGADAPLLLDEAQRFLDRRALQRVLASARTVVFSSHEDLARLCARPLVTHRLDDAPRALLDDVVRARLAWARREPGEPEAPPAALLDALHAQHRGNLRAIEHVLYDWYQQHWS